MAEKKNVTTQLKELEEEFKEGTAVKTEETTKPAPQKDTDSAKQAVNTRIDDEYEKRKNFSLGAKVTEIVTSAPPAINILVDGNGSVGKLSNPSKTLSTIIEKAGIVEDPDGNIIAENCPNNITDNRKHALELYNMVKKAQTEDVDFEVYVNENQKKPMKALYIQKPGEKEAVAFDVKTAIELVMAESLGVLTFTDKKLQLSLQAVSKRKTKTGAIGSSAKAEKKNPFAGIASLRMNNKDEAYDKHNKFWKELTTEVDNAATGMKSKLSFKYISDRKDTKGNPIISTYRVPLLTKQYKLTVSQADLKALLGEGLPAAGQKVPTYELGNEAALKELASSIKAVLTSAVTANIEGGLFDSIREASAEAQSKQAADQAAELKNLGI